MNRYPTRFLIFAKSKLGWAIYCRQSLIVASITVALLSVGAAPALAQITWQMSTEYPQTNISGVGLTTFAKFVSSQTDGFVTAKTSFNNELKISSGEMVRAAQDGRIAGGDAFAGPLAASDAIFGLASLPFVVQSIDAAQAVNTRARPLYEKALEADGLKLLYITVWPATGLWSDRPLNKIDDLVTLAVRTYDYTSAEVFRATGARAEYLPFNEAIAKLKDHMLNAVLTSGDGGAGQRLWDYLHYFSPINYAVPISLTFVRMDAFQSLPKAVQEQVMAAAAETEKSQFDLLANRTAENYARMRANGVIIAEPTAAAIIATPRQAAAGPVAAWKAKVPADAVAIVNWASQR